MQFLPIVPVVRSNEGIHFRPALFPGIEAAPFANKKYRHRRISRPGFLQGRSD